MRYAIGIDMGGTKIDACIVNENGKIIDKLRIPTEAKKGRAKVLKNLADTVTELKNRNKGKKVSGIGIGIPGFTDKNGRIVNMPNIPSMLGFNLISFLKKKFGCPVFVENDANCFALAEHTFGAGKGAEMLVGVIVGTGIGSGIVYQGKIISGCEGGAGEIGHILSDMSAKKLQIGRNDFESEGAGPFLTRRYVKSKGNIRNPDPKKIFNSDDPVARKIVNYEYDYLGKLMSIVVNTLNPDCIVLGGGVSNVLSPSRLAKELKKYAVPFSAKRVKVKKNKLGDFSGVLGAAALVFRNA